MTGAGVLTDAGALARLAALYDFAVWSMRVGREHVVALPPGW
jgi:hypothetical protein